MKNLYKTDSREAFEDWCEAEHMPFEVSTRFAKDEDGDYINGHTWNEWEAWRAGVEFAKRSLTKEE